MITMLQIGIRHHAEIERYAKNCVSCVRGREREGGEGAREAERSGENENSKT